MDIKASEFWTVKAGTHHWNGIFLGTTMLWEVCPKCNWKFRCMVTALPRMTQKSQIDDWDMQVWRIVESLDVMKISMNAQSKSSLQVFKKSFLFSVTSKANPRIYEDLTGDRSLSLSSKVGNPFIKALKKQTWTRWNSSRRSNLVLKHHWYFWEITNPRT